MAGKVIGTSMNYGYAGNYARTPDDIVASRKLAAASNDIAFGDAVELKSDNTFTAVNSNTTAGLVAGIALRVVKQATNYANQNIVGYVAGEMINVLERGAATVVCRKGTPTAGGTVYVRIATHGTDTYIGGFEATSDSGYNVEVPNMKWTNGYVDANGVTEVTILTRVNP